MRNLPFNKTALATSISLLLGTSAATPLYAQPSEDEDERVVEEVVVSGIRGSLMRAMDKKRYTTGVMDAISAEEMGKFPDTNLAESLQRITGVSVSRSNGEGSEITVRGFGPDFNLVTLNGRQMPSTGFARSFKFENLSSDGVSALEVYKTAAAKIPTGGLGATVNIVTAKPFDNPGERYSFSLKGVKDTSNVEGRDLTPEISGIFSKTFNDDKLGFAFNFTHSERDFQQQFASSQGWDSAPTLPIGLDPANAIDNRPTDGNGDPIAQFRQLNQETGQYESVVGSFFPRDLNFGFEDVERARTNAQFTFQVAATDDIEVTLDYTLTDVTFGRNALSWGLWKPYGGGTIQAYELDPTGTATYVETIANDASFTASRSTNTVESDSVGINVDWNFSENLRFVFDYHDSSSETDNAGDSSLDGSVFAVVASNQFSTKAYDFRSGDIPGFIVNYDNGTNVMSPGEISPNFAQLENLGGKSEIEQFRFSGEWFPEFDFIPLSTVSFGADWTDQSLGGAQSLGRIGTPGLGQYYPQIFPDSMFVQQNTEGLLDNFSGGGSALSPNYYYAFDLDETLIRMSEFFGDEITAFQGDPSPKSLVQEETLSFYLQTLFEFEVGSMPVEINLGLRYEETDVSSPSQSRIPVQVVWVDESTMVTEFAGGDGALTSVTNEGSYDLLLPSFDIKVDISEELVTRLSWGQTISRPGLGFLLGGTSISGFPNFTRRDGSRGNPSVKPFLSTNFDLSVEYYYDESSYASIGFFTKDVDDWIDVSLTTLTFDGLHDIIGGARYNEAVAQLAELGNTDPTRPDVYNQLIANGFGDANGVISPDPNTDPLIQWTISSPENVDERSVEGIEISWQHTFGDSGFGTSINATFVDGDVEVDPYTYGSQTALPGLSDSANWQGFYEDEKLSVKFTYAWRDKYFAGFGHNEGSNELDLPPQFVKEYGQWDLSINYDVNDNMTVFFEGININDETEEGYGRFESQFMFARQYGPRYAVGFRYSVE